MAQLIALPNGEQVEFPDGTPDDVMEKALADYIKANPDAAKPPRPAEDTRSAGEVAANSAGLFGRGFNDTLADVVGGPVDLAAAGMRYAGLPVPAEPVGGSASVRRGIRAVTDAFGTPAAPITTPERLAYGAGQGVGEAASIALPAGAIARGARAGTMLQGTAEALAANPVLQGASSAIAGATTEATDSPWLGMAAGMVAPVAAGAGRRVISPVRQGLNAEQQRLADVARQEGLELTPGQLTGSRTLQGTESVFGELPFTQGPRRAQITEQQQAYNRAILRRAGVDADLATPEVLADARASLGQEFADLSARNSLDANGSTRFLNDLAALDSSLDDASGDVATRVRGLMDELLNKADPQTMRISGEFYQNFQSRLSRIIRENGHNSELRNRIRDLRDAVRNGMEDSIRPEDAAQWRDTTRRYANLKNVENAMNTGSNAATSGNISGNALAQAVKNSTAGGFAMGRGDLNDLARVGQQFVRDPIGNSGTAQRTMLMNTLKGSALTGAIGGGAATVASLPAAAAIGTAGLALPKLAQLAYDTRTARRYLTNQLAANYRARNALPGVMAADIARLRGQRDE
ncbi:hypothetical protein [Roseomonas chloroacetimidivorans]|uniref:hypothetical protein n=1 Tax=Roseomonas chloroacetimidivorans TaxID=1766656 RepID=UPI003C739B7C